MKNLQLKAIEVLVVAGLLGCADVSAATDETGNTTQADSVSVAAAPALPAEAARLLTENRALTAAELDHVYSLDHFVPVGPGRRVHVNERFSLRSWLRLPHREMLMLPGTVTKGDFYDIDVDGYRFQDEVAARGFFAFSVDYEGSGESTYPADGHTVTHPFLVNEIRPVLEYTRLIRLVSRVDVFGESNGGAIASEICADGRRVRSCTMASMIYKFGTPFFVGVFEDPAFLAMLDARSAPNGYIDATPDLYFNIVSGMPAAVSAWTLAHEPGSYAIAPLLEPEHLPWFDPTHAAVPGLIVQGTDDDIALQSDSDALAADYGSAPGAGGHATIVRIANGGHVPRVQPAPVNEDWKRAVFNFVDP